MSFAAALAARLPARWQRGWGQRVRVRPTREGWWFLGILFGLAFASFNTGNNLLYLVLSLMLATLVVQNVLAEWNLRGVGVRRVLPEEVFADEAAFGAFELHNRRRLFTSLDLSVEELDGGEARAAVAVVSPGEVVRAPAPFTFARRGPGRLGRVRLSSDFPFGIFMRSRDFSLPAELIVYPSRRAGEVRRAATEPGQEHQDATRRGSGGGFFGVRAYAPGDPLRRIHGPTTARVGELMIVEYSAERAHSAVLRPGGDEVSLARACGEAVQLFYRGHRVGLELGELVIEPSAGSAHRRRVLTALALHRAKP